MTQVSVNVDQQPDGQWVVVTESKTAALNGSYTAAFATKEAALLNAHEIAAHLRSAGIVARVWESLGIVSVFTDDPFANPWDVLFGPPDDPKDELPN